MILAVELVDKNASDVDAVGRINERHLSTIDNHGNIVCLGKYLQGLADFLLQRCKNFLTTLIVGRLSILTFTLKVLLEFFPLIDLGRQRLLIDWGCRRGALEFGDLVLKLLTSLLHLSQIVFLLLELAVKRRQDSVELRDSGLRIQKRIRINQSDLADGQSDVGLGSRGRLA